MKNKILFCAMLCLACTFSVTVNAQLEVIQSGDVIVNKNLEVGDTLAVNEYFVAQNNAYIADTLKVGRKLNVRDTLYVNGNIKMPHAINTDYSSTNIIRNLRVGLNMTVEKGATIKEGLIVNKNITIGNVLNDNASLNIDTISRKTNAHYGIMSHVKTANSMPTGSVYGVCGWADASATTSNYPITQIVGVYGKAVRATQLSSFSAGVAGMANMYGGVAVYGGIGMNPDLPLPTTFSGVYAVYFNGTVNVNGSLIATTLSTTSDYNKKENIKKIELELAGKINQLQPISYTFKQDSTWKYDKEATELQGVHYGLIAQEVQKVFPELVYERGGQLSINYIELIPLLILEVQKLSAEVEVLQKKIDGK